jgi:hypothetical protein
LDAIQDGLRSDGKLPAKVLKAFQMPYRSIFGTRKAMEVNLLVENPNTDLSSLSSSDESSPVAVDNNAPSMNDEMEMYYQPLTSDFDWVTQLEEIQDPEPSLSEEKGGGGGGGSPLTQGLAEVSDSLRSINSMLISCEDEFLETERNLNDDFVHMKIEDGKITRNRRPTKKPNPCLMMYQLNNTIMIQPLDQSSNTSTNESNTISVVNGTAAPSKEDSLATSFVSIPLDEPQKE